LTKEPLDYGNESELVKSIDESLTYKENMYAKGSSCLSLRVERDGIDCVLKVRRKTSNAWDEMYFFYETHALKKAEEKKVPGVSRLLEEYDNGRYQAILKPFIHGTPGNKKDVSELYDNPEFVKKLDALYLALHLAGISNISFLPRKIVFTDDDEIVLVDLSSCLVHTEVGVLQFNQTMREDSHFITRLEKKIRRKQKAEQRRMKSQA
jgi:predicted N-acyltransferase